MAVVQAVELQPPEIQVDWWEQFANPPGYRAEIIQGELVVSPSPVFRHQIAVTRLSSLLDEASPKGYVAVADMEWRLAEAGVVASAPWPDVMVVRPAGNGFATPPLLAVEVLSPSDDQTLLGGLTRFEGKAADYHQNGLRYLLVVQPDPQVVFLLVADDDENDWTEMARAVGDEVFETDVPFPFSLQPKGLVAL
jgi:Uma2 family endonuclease